LTGVEERDVPMALIRKKEGLFSMEGKQFFLGGEERKESIGEGDFGFLHVLKRKGKGAGGFFRQDAAKRQVSREGGFGP